MKHMGISTDPAMLSVELPSTLIESPSVSTFMPEEEASVCPLLSSANRNSTPIEFTHPLNNESNESANLCNDAKEETGSSTGSSSGIAMEISDSLFRKHAAYQHLQHNNGTIIQDANGNAANGSLKLSDDAPCFVSWNWPVIRKCTFYAFMSSLFAMTVVVIAMIVTLPNTCNPRTAWYRGSVFYEVFPASFQDSNNDGVGDLRGISNRVHYFASMGFSAVRLNSIFPTSHYPENYKNVTSLNEIAEVLGSIDDLHHLAESLHAHNISLILDLPINQMAKELGRINQYLGTSITVTLNNSSSTLPDIIHVSDNMISRAMRKWLRLGVDGFYIKGLEQFVNDENIINNIAAWKSMLGSNRILMVSDAFLNGLTPFNQAAARSYVDLVDVYLDVSRGTKHMEEIIRANLKGSLAPEKTNVWIHWNIGGVDSDRVTGRTQHKNITLAATIMELMLPGTPSIFYGDEISLEAVSDPNYEHNQTAHLHHLSTMQWLKTGLQFTNRENLPWLPSSIPFNLENAALVSEMIKLRERSPSIYLNAICKPETKLQNTQLRRSHDDVMLVERIYPRRNSYVSVSNFGPRRITMDMTSMFYSGLKMINDGESSEKVYFENFDIGPFETIVVRAKLNKNYSSEKSDLASTDQESKQIFVSASGKETDTPSFVRLVVMRLIYGLASTMGLEERLEDTLMVPPKADDGLLNLSDLGTGSSTFGDTLLSGLDGDVLD